MLERAAKATEKLLYGPRIPLNDEINARFENPRVISLHVASEGDDKQQGLGNMRQGWREGLKVLAQKLQKEESLKEVTTIVATSWFIRVVGPMFEELGFNVDYTDTDPEGKYFRNRNTIRNRMVGVPEKYREVKVCFAKMSREELLQRYGS